MAKPAKKPTPIELMIRDASVPAEQRAEMLSMMAHDPNPEAQAAYKSALIAVLSNAATNGDEIKDALTRELQETLRLLNEGPQRHARFIGPILNGGAGPHQALVVLDDGTNAYTLVTDAALAKSLRVGEAVRLDGRGRALLGRAAETFQVGEEAQFERRLDRRRVEVRLHGDERAVLLASDDLAEALDRGEVESGAALIVNPRQFFALHPLPPVEGVGHFTFLERVPVPDVRVERDIGAPPKCIEELTALIRLELTQPGVRRRYKLRRCVMKLLAGVSGSGKTLTIHAIWRRMYEVMSEVTGVALDELPPRVFWLRPGRLLSKWFGESERLIERALDEVQALADEKFRTPDGRDVVLPVLVIIEELDGLARSRHESDPVYSRVLTTLLQRLDPSRPELQQRFIIFLGTTNEPGQVDRAFLRRIGGTVEVFGRLNRRGFTLVLDKHLSDLPLAANNGHTPDELRREFTGRMASWLFSPNGADPGLVELTFAGSTTSETRHRRDFLTGALIDRAVQQSAEAASRSEAAGATRPGVSLEELAHSLDEQLRSVADQLNPGNAGQFLTLPDGARVATVRRVPQPALLPFDLERATH